MKKTTIVTIGLFGLLLFLGLSSSSTTTSAVEMCPANEKYGGISVHGFASGTVSLAATAAAARADCTSKIPSNAHTYCNSGSGFVCEAEYAQCKTEATLNPTSCTGSVANCGIYINNGPTWYTCSVDQDVNVYCKCKPK